MLERAFRDDTSARRFITEILPELHQVRHEDFLLWVEESVNVLVCVNGETGGPWHVCVDRNGLAVIEGAVPSALLATIELDREDWYGFKLFLAGFRSELEGFLESRVPAPPRKLDSQCFESLIAIKATLNIVVDGIFSDGGAACAIHLGGERGKGPTANIELHADDLEDVLDRVATPLDLYRERRLSFEGETGILARIGTILAPYLPFRLG